MKENLRTTKYPDGTSILYGPNYSPTTSTTIGYYYHANNNSSNDATYGLQYNWTAAMNNSLSSSNIPSGVQGICPTGWHLPSQAELNNLLTYINIGFYSCNGTATYSAKAIASTANWTSYSGNSCYVGYDLSSNNASGFSLQPAGRYYYGGYTDSFKTMATLWSTSTYNTTRGYCLYILNSSTTPTIASSTTYAQLSTGHSVRCLKD